MSCPVKKSKQTGRRMEAEAIVAAVLTILPDILPRIVDEVIKKMKQVEPERVSGENEVKELKEKVREMEEMQTENMERVDRKLTDLENRNRRDNLVFMNLHKCDPTRVDQEVIEFVTKVLQIRITQGDIVRAHYLGKTDLVICKFREWRVREAIFKASYGQPAGVKVMEDFSFRTR